MSLLRATLRCQAVLWALSGGLLLTAPGWLVESVLDQPPLGQDAWLRLAGASAIALAAQMVLVGHRIEELWWWSWSFTLLEAATAAVFLATAIAGPTEGAATWPWWLAGAMNGAFGLVQFVALAISGTERSPA